MIALARRAVEDRSVFGSDLDLAREQIAKLDRTAESAARDLDVHKAALEAYDPASLRKGVLLLGVVVVLFLALILAPIVWRATRVIAPD
jgi:tetrahydromethanopterin S-methyltransferase subunit B